MAFTYDLNYYPGRPGGLGNKAVSTTAVSSGALTADDLYQVLCTVDVWWKLMGATGDAVCTSATAEYLPSYEWSPPFAPKTTGSVVSAKRGGSVSGTMHVRKIGKR
jgi:hypothetical protein